MKNIENVEHINIEDKSQTETIKISKSNYDFITQIQFVSKFNDTFDNCLSQMIKSYKILDGKVKELEREMDKTTIKK